MKKIHSGIKARIMEIGIRQEQVAGAVGYSTSQFSRILRGRERTPDGFEGVVHSAMDRLERAEQAAQEARARVLSEKDG